jgi:hypothetical protein
MAFLKFKHIFALTSHFSPHCPTQIAAGLEHGFIQTRLVVSQNLGTMFLAFAFLFLLTHLL